MASNFTIGQSPDTSVSSTLSNQIRASKTFFFEVLFVAGDQPQFPGTLIGSYRTTPDVQLINGVPYYSSNAVRVNLSNIKFQASSATTRPILYTISLSDYVIEHKDNTSTDPNNPNGFLESNREVIVISSNQITQGKTRFLTILGSDSGIGLFGSNAIVLQDLPDSADIKLGFINTLDASDTEIYDPNEILYLPIGDPNTDYNLTPQYIKYALLRFAVSVQYL